MSEYRKVPTTAEVYSLLLNTHKDSLSVFETFSNPDGSFSGGSTGEMMTVWGFKGADYPLFGARSTWDLVPVDSPFSPGGYRVDRQNSKHTYWLCLPVKETE